MKIKDITKAILSELSNGVKLTPKQISVKSNMSLRRVYDVLTILLHADVLVMEKKKYEGNFYSLNNSAKIIVANELILTLESGMVESISNRGTSVIIKVSGKSFINIKQS